MSICYNVLYKSDKRKKEKLKKEGKMKISILIYLYSTLCLPKGVHKILKYWLQ